MFSGGYTPRSRMLRTNEMNLAFGIAHQHVTVSAPSNNTSSSRARGWKHRLQQQHQRQQRDGAPRKLCPCIVSSSSPRLSKCNNELVKKSATAKSGSELKWHCGVCGWWSPMMYCSDPSCQERECVPKAGNNMCQVCPTCHKEYGKAAMNTESRGGIDVVPVVFVPMAPSVVDRLLERCFARPRCANAACGTDSIVTDANSCSSCSKCGLVLFKCLVQEHLQPRQDEEEQSEREGAVSSYRQQQGTNMDVFAMGLTQAERREMTDEQRMRKHFKNTWSINCMHPTDATDSAKLTEECVQLLLLYMQHSGDKLKFSSHTMSFQAAALFLVTQNDKVLSLRYSPVELVDRFLCVRNAKVDKPPSRRVVKRTEKVVWNELVNKIGCIRQALGAHMPLQYQVSAHISGGDGSSSSGSGQHVSLFWLFVTDLLRVRGNSELFPLETHDQEALLATLNKLQNDPTRRAIAQTSLPFSVAGFVYSHALNGRAKTVNGKCVRMTVELAMSIMRVCTTTLSDLRNKFSDL